MDERVYSLRDAPDIIPMPLLWMLAMEVGDWRNAATACIEMIRLKGDCELWNGRLREVRRRAGGIHRRADGGELRGVGDHLELVETATD